MVALAQWLYANSTRRSCSSQLVGSSSTTIVSIRAVVCCTRSTLPLPVVGACGNFANPEELVNGVRELEAELEVIVREGVARAPPEGNMPVDENVSRCPQR